MGKKEYSGYGYHGGGRKKLAPEEKKVYKTVSISGTPEQIEELKKAAVDAGLTVSRYVLEKCLKQGEDYDN